MTSPSPATSKVHAFLSHDVDFSPALAIGLQPTTHRLADRSDSLVTAAVSSSRDAFNRMLQLGIKRVMDIAGASALLIILSPLLLAITLLVKRDGAPALFFHPRIGRDAVVFPCLKFRSMKPESDALLERHLANNPTARAEWEATHKLKDDPRVTRFGAFLRTSSLDELPQLLNVLKGDMSLVGPRPIVAEEVEKYQHDIAQYYRVRPGITGLWQVSGRNDVSYQERVAMDSWYVEHWTLWRDLVILLKTVPALLRRSGAY